MKFKDAALDFLEYIEVTRSKGTYDFQYSNVAILIKFFGDTELDTIDKKSIIKFISHRRKLNPDITATTLNKYIASLKRIIKYNIEKDIVFDKLPENNKIVPVIKPETINILFRHLKDNFHIKEKFRNYVLFKLLLDTGLRINEALNLKISDFSFDTNTIHVKITKTKNERYVFFTHETAKILKKYIVTWQIKDYFFVVDNDGVYSPLKVDSVMKITTRLRKLLNISESLRPHKWRHTFATNFLKRGGNLETLRLILGHSTLTTTQIYLHLDKDHLHSEYFKINPK